MDSRKFSGFAMDLWQAFRKPSTPRKVAPEPRMHVELNDDGKMKSDLSLSSLKITELDDDDGLERERHMLGVIDEYEEYLAERTRHMIGFPSNLDFEYGALSRFLSFAINNAGDPFIESHYGLHSKQFEVAVLDWFARLWDLEKNEYWGYVTSGGTEGNFHGFLLGREIFPNGILYTSTESHYSVFKAASIFRIDSARVKTLVSGEMDCSDFRAKLLQNKDRPAIVNVNIGTTVKGAIDDLDSIIKVLKESGFEGRFYIHCDGALLGLMLPFMKKAPKISFKNQIDSMSVSGHKFLGCPFPCGVQITRKKHIKAFSSEGELISLKDTTILGSRNGHASLFLWHGLSRMWPRGLQERVDKCLQNAQFLKKRLRRAGIGAMLNEFSNIVVFERPQDGDLVRKWQLLCEGEISHVVVMPNLTKETIIAFVDELVQARLIRSKGGAIPPPCIAREVGDENCCCNDHLRGHARK